MTTTTTYNYITDTGTIVAETTTVLADVQSEFKAALGDAIDLGAQTPQGTLITAEVLARTNVMRNNAEVANSINPDLAYGTFLDAVCSLLGVARGVNVSTKVTGVTITGTANTVVQDGSRMRTSNNDIYVTVGAVTIPDSGDGTGSTTGTIQSQTAGPVPAPTGPLTIVDGTIGWGSATVETTSAITLGTLALTDPQLRNSRKVRLAAQGSGSVAAIKANLLAVDNVTSVQIVENNTGAAGTINGIDFSLPNAIWVCVAGTASKSDIAAALFDAHNGGTPWEFGSAGNGTPVDSPNGTSVVDPSTGLTYNVKYTTPVIYDVYVNITVNNAASASSPVQAVQNSIINYAEGKEDGEAGFIVAANVSAFEVAGSVIRQLPGMYVKNSMVACVPAGSTAPVFPTDYVLEFVMPQYGQAQIVAGNIAVSVA